jgi:hypothetical protein
MVTTTFATFTKPTSVRGDDGVMFVCDEVAGALYQVAADGTRRLFSLQERSSLMICQASAGVVTAD